MAIKKSKSDQWGKTFKNFDISKEMKKTGYSGGPGDESSSDVRDEPGPFKAPKPLSAPKYNDFSDMRSSVKGSLSKSRAEIASAKSPEDYSQAMSKIGSRPAVRQVEPASPPAKKKTYDEPAFKSAVNEARAPVGGLGEQDSPDYSSGEGVRYRDLHQEHLADAAPVVEKVSPVADLPTSRPAEELSGEKKQPYQRYRQW